MELKGKVFKVLPEQTGTGKNGPWRKQDFIIETEGQYPKKVCITMWGDKIDQFAIKESESLTAHINIESREYRDKWFTDVKAWKVEKSGGGAGPAPNQDGSIPDDITTFHDEDFDDDSPF
ncbi:MAG: DUF3127 domain-containing protein [Balneolales bacterium]